MREIGIILIVLAIVLFAVNWYISRQRRERGEGAPAGARRRQVAAEPPDDFTHPRPNLSSFHVHANEARVTFAVPYPEEGDEVLSDLLIGEAIEVVREKRHTLPIDDVTEVVVFAGEEPGREVGRMSLETPGVLPPPSRFTDILNLTSIGADPLAAEFEEGPATMPETVAPARSDQLEPLGEMIRLPKAVATGLRAQGVDPDNMTAAQLVTGILSLFGYNVAPGIGEGHYTATKGGSTTLIVSDDYAPGDYPEVEESSIRSFVVAVEQSNADRGMFVSEKFAPFSIHELERRNSRIRFVTRERLQKLVDSMALS